MRTKADGNYQIIAECKKGHVSTLTLIQVPDHHASMIAGIMDGTSPFYKYKPDEKSMIGKCGICGTQFGCEVYEVMSL